MAPTEKAHCRLCAKIKPIAKLVNLANDTETRDVIVSKLNKFNINIGFNASDDELPSTVCLICVNSLNSACDFVANIQKAQEILKEELLEIKKEDTSDFEYEYVQDGDDQETVDEQIQIKEESCDLNIGPTVVNVPNTNNDQVVSDLDNIPLAQLKLTWEDYNWKCANCDTLFPNITELKAHSMQFHQRCNAFKCSECNVRKSRLKAFLIHVKHEHKQYLRLSCHICFKRFKRPNDIRLHRKVHIRTKFFCVGCHEPFKSSDELEKHDKAYRKNFKQGMFVLAKGSTCSVCQKSFAQRSSLQTHMLLHTENKYRFTCEICGKGFLTKSGLKDHILSVHENFRPYQCQICNLKFRKLKTLRQHIGTHNGDKPFECEQCGKCFRLRIQLKSHSIIHTDKLPYVCLYCNKGFKFKTLLNQHIHQHTGAKPYSCDKCDKSFSNWSNYNKHMKLKHDTDMSKRKRTANGTQTRDPKTGELIHYETTNKIDQWRKEVLETGELRGKKKTKVIKNLFR